MSALEIEQEMEAKNLPESDREEVRRLVAYLQRRRDQRDGKDVPPMSAEQRAWLLGKDDTASLSQKAGDA